VGYTQKRTGGEKSGKEIKNVAMRQTHRKSREKLVKENHLRTNGFEEKRMGCREGKLVRGKSEGGATRKPKKKLEEDRTYGGLKKTYKE